MIGHTHVGVGSRPASRGEVQDDLQRRHDHHARHHVRRHLRPHGQRELLRRAHPYGLGSAGRRRGGGPHLPDRQLGRSTRGRAHGNHRGSWPGGHRVARDLRDARRGYGPGTGGPDGGQPTGRGVHPAGERRSTRLTEARFEDIPSIEDHRTVFMTKEGAGWPTPGAPSLAPASGSVTRPKRSRPPPGGAGRGAPADRSTWSRTPSPFA